MKYLLLLLSIVLCISLQAQDDQTTIIERESSISKEVKVEEENGILNVRIVTTDEDGNQDVMVWSGTEDDPDMPEEIKAYVMGDDVQHGNMRKKKQMRLKVIDDEGNEKLLEWDGEGEMPAEMKEHILENGRRMTEEARDMRRNELKERHMEHRKERAEGGEYGGRDRSKGKGKGRRDEKKAKLGIVINDDNGSVGVKEVMDNSAADIGGMLPNDIITVVDDTVIDNFNRLQAELATHNPGDTIKVTVNRNGKKKKLKITLD